MTNMITIMMMIAKMARIIIHRDQYIGGGGAVASFSNTSFPSLSLTPVTSFMLLIFLSTFIEICYALVRTLVSLGSPIIQGGTDKTERHTSYNTWMQYMVSVYEVTSPSPEKNYTKISHFGSVVSLLGHIVWDNVEIKCRSPFQLKPGLHECHFGLP